MAFVREFWKCFSVLERCEIDRQRSYVFELGRSGEDSAVDDRWISFMYVMHPWV